MIWAGRLRAALGFQKVALGGGRILGVCCDGQQIASARSILEAHGFQVVTATTLRGALAACAAKRFDFIVVGRSVPGSIAVALGERLRDAGPPVVCLSAVVSEKECSAQRKRVHELQTQLLRLLAS